MGVAAGQSRKKGAKCGGYYFVGYLGLLGNQINNGWAFDVHQLHPNILRHVDEFVNGTSLFSQVMFSEVFLLANY